MISPRVLVVSPLPEPSQPRDGDVVPASHVELERQFEVEWQVVETAPARP